MARELDDPARDARRWSPVAPQPRRLAPAALFGESIVEGREALGTRDGDQEVPPDEADQSLDLALVVALARPAEPVLEQIVGLKLREDARSLPLPIAQDPGNRQLGVVVQDGSGDAAEEGKRRVVAIAECFGRLRRIGRNKATITVGKVEGKEWIFRNAPPITAIASPKSAWA